MATRPRSSESSHLRRPPATTLQGREDQLITLAVDLAEQQLAAGTAPTQVITHYLKLGSSREKIEQHRIELESKLAAAKVEMLEAQARQEEKFDAALKAMRAYQGIGDENRHDD